MDYNIIYLLSLHRFRNFIPNRKSVRCFNDEKKKKKIGIYIK